jgi:recombinational DNA repair protein RecT
MSNLNQTPDTSGKVAIVQLLNNTAPSKIPDIPEIGKRFRQLYRMIHRGESADVFYEAEKYHFAKLISENKKLAECTKFSLYGCFLDGAVNGLSFDPSFKHQFLIPQPVNVGTKAAPQWESRATIQISGPGELLLRIKQGHVKYADNPVLVYESDEFAYGTKNDRLFVEHKAIIPRKSTHIIAAYVKIIRADGSIDYKMIDEQDMNRFRNASKQANSPAWVDGIAGMWLAKVIKHAFGKTYPKVRTGNFSNLATNTVDAEAEGVLIPEELPAMVVPDQIDYGTGELKESAELKEVKAEAQAIRGYDRPGLAGYTGHEAFTGSKDPVGVNDDTAFQETKAPAGGVVHSDGDDF